MFDAAIAAAAAATPHKIELPPVQPGLVLHVDGDYLAYYAAGNDDTDPGQARLNAISLIEEYRARVGAESAVVHSTALHSHKGERFLAATVKPYQGQRSGGRKPKNHAYLQNWLHQYDGSAFRSKLWATREADDGMAACAHYAIGTPVGYAAIATADKDLRMVPGIHINWQTRQVTRVLPGEYDVIGEDGKQYGLKWFWLQMLTGDTADNIPGLEQYLHNDGKKSSFKKVSEVTAAKLLADCTTNDEAAKRVVELYRGGYCEGPLTLWADRFVEQAALLWMRCGNDAALDDFLTHKGHSCISGALPWQELLNATERMKERVALARKQVDALAS